MRQLIFLCLLCSISFFSCGDESSESSVEVEIEVPESEILPEPTEAPIETEKETPPQPSSSNAEIPAAFQSEMLMRVNAIRAEGCRCGNRNMRPVPALTWNRKLAQAALAHAKDMDTNDFFDHTGHDGSSSSDRATRSQYQWQAVGENISWNVMTVEKAVQGWKESPGHCKNMMSKDFAEMGAAQKGPYMVQVFGRSL